MISFPCRFLLCGSLATLGLLAGCNTPATPPAPVIPQTGSGKTPGTERAAVKATVAADQYQLGRHYEDGEGVVKDLIVAAEWYARAAAQNHVEAINHLAALWRKGIPPKGRDYVEALRLSRQAAALGDAEGQHDTADMLRYGRGATKDPAEAFRLFCLAANQGDGSAAHKAGRMLSHGELGENNFTEARHWFDRAVELGHRDSLIEIGLQYFEGRGRPVDNQQAFIWFEKAARQGAEWAQNQVGSMLLLGMGIDRDEEEAITWFRLAAAKKYPDAFINLGSCYFNGTGVPKDLDRAEDCYRQAVALGEKTAASALAALAGTAPDRERRIRLLREATPVLLEIETQADAPVQWALGGALLHPDNPLGDAQHGVRLLESLRSSEPAVLMQLATHYLRSHQWTEARRSLEDAMTRGVEGSDYYLGLACFIGLGAAPDPLHGAVLLEKAAATHPIERAYLYYFGIGRPRDETRALALVEQAAERGDEEARRARSEQSAARQLAAVFQPEPRMQTRPTSPLPAADGPPAFVETCAPIYPLMARYLDLTCEVTVLFTVDEQGLPQAIETEGTPPAAFADSAKAAVSRWRFLPAMRDGVAVLARVRQVFVFNLQDASPPAPPRRPTS